MKRMIALLAAILFCACAPDGQGPAESLAETAETSPTVAATATPRPTYTPLPTYTPYPTYTPPPTVTRTPQPSATPYPTQTPYPTATPEPARGESRRNPAQIGDSLLVRQDSWFSGSAMLELELLSLVSGDQAWDMVRQANMFNDPPGEGREYILAEFRVKVLEVEEEPYEMSHAMFDAVSADGRVYGEFISVAGLEPSLRIELYEGAEHIGWTYFLVERDDTPVAAFDRGSASERWFVLRP
jgi:hypothetical protein